MPDFVAYHQSLNAELTAIKDRVRNLINHWPTDGTFKESVLRNLLRRHLPESLYVGTGFVVTKTEASTQIDILIVDKEHPRLFWDGELVIVTPEAVRAAIEVKTRLNNRAEIENTIRKAVANKRKWKNALYGWKNFLGLFVYEERGDQQEAVLRSLDKARQQYKIEMDSVVVGANLFIDRPGRIGYRDFQGWVSRRTNDAAAAWFIGKLIAWSSQMSILSNSSAWQPAMAEDSELKYMPMDDSGKIEIVSLASCFQKPENGPDM